MQIPCQITFVSLNSKTTGIASETGATYLSETNAFASVLSWDRIAQFLFFMCWFLPAIVCPTVFADCSVFPLNYTFLLPLRYLQTYFLTKQT